MSNGNSSLPCVDFPAVPGDVKVALPFGGELQALRDFTQGLPSDCTLTFNLLLQLPPLLASIICPLKVINVIMKIKDFMTHLPDLSKAGDVVTAITDLGECVPIPGVSFLETIKDILLLVLRFLKCLLEEIESVLKLQVNISLQMDQAQGNPEWLRALTCAQNNAQVSMQHLTSSVGPILPLLKLVQTLASIAQIQGINLPDLSGISPAGSSLQEVEQTVDQMRQAVTLMQQVVDAL